MDTSLVSLNSATVPNVDLAGLVDIAATNSLGGIGLWRHVYVDIGARAAADRIAAEGLRVTSVCRGGMFPTATAEQARAAYDDNRRAVDEAHTLGADCLVIVCGAAVDRDLDGARCQVAEGLVRLAGYASTAGVPLAVEPMHPMMIADRSVITSISEAVDLIDQVGDSNVGLALDAYHVWWDVDYPEQTLRAADRVHSVQISDWIVPIRDQLRSRGMPGEGMIDLSRFLDVAQSAGYQGMVEVEVLSDRWAEQPAQMIVEAMLEAVVTL